VLTLVSSVLLVVFLVIPEAIFRLIYGFFIPTKVWILTRVEKAFRAVLLTIIPFFLAMAFSWYLPGPDRWPFPVTPNGIHERRVDYRLVEAALYSEAEFQKSNAQFWPAFTRCIRRQARLAFWYYLLVALEAWRLGKLSSNYHKHKWFADKFLSSYISQWYPLLTPPNKEIQADVLCTNETLYQGNISQYFLKDGELAGFILENPKRFHRPLFHKAREEGKEPKKTDYWIPIPSSQMYFFVDKILNINLSYISLAKPDLIPDSSAVAKFLRPQFGSLKVSVKTKQETLSDGEKKRDL